MSIRPQPPEPVAFSLEDSAKLPGALKRLLETEVATRLAGLHNSAKDYADYKSRCGEITGLRIAISLCEQATKQLEG